MRNPAWFAGVRTFAFYRSNAAMDLKDTERTSAYSISPGINMESLQ
jgi:hypothetical protein